MKFVAHPEDIPLIIEEIDYLFNQKQTLDISGFGGISYLSRESYKTGQCIQLQLTEIDPDFCVVGRIYRCDKEKDKYRIFIEFPQKEDCYYVRMIEQLSQIEHYRRKEKQQGRRLNFNEAATEWIQKFAASFPEFSH